MDNSQSKSSTKTDSQVQSQSSVSKNSQVKPAVSKYKNTQSKPRPAESKSTKVKTGSETENNIVIPKSSGKTVAQIQEEVVKAQQGPATEKAINEEMKKRQEKVDQDIKEAQKEVRLDIDDKEEEISGEEKQRQIEDAIKKNLQGYELEEKI